MRIVNTLSGVAVLLSTLALGHLLHYYFVNASHEDSQSPAFLAVLVLAVFVAIFSFIGGCLLLRRRR